jgi:aldehyde dehydrogenase (NAD+)
VFPDADLSQAIEWSIFGIGLHAGQVCHAGTRIYVHEDIYDDFLAAFTTHMAKIKVGSNFSSETDQGPQINKPQYNKILGYIDTGKKEGATLHLGGGPVSHDGGYFIEPTIFTDVTPDMKVRVLSLSRHLGISWDGGAQKANFVLVVLTDFERGDLWPRSGDCQVPV